MRSDSEIDGARWSFAAAAHEGLLGGEDLGEIQPAAGRDGGARGVGGIRGGESRNAEKEQGENAESAEDRFHNDSFPAENRQGRPAPIKGGAVRERMRGARSYRLSRLNLRIKSSTLVLGLAGFTGGRPALPAA